MEQVFYRKILQHSIFFLPGRTAGNIMVKGLVNTITDVQIVGTDQHVKPKVVGKISWSPVPGLVFIDAPGKYKDLYMTVLKLKLDGKIKLYRGQGGLNLLFFRVTIARIRYKQSLKLFTRMSFSPPLLERAGPR